MKISGLTDVGLKRTLNEDSIFIHNEKNRFIALISDGMGGHNAGEIASKMVIDSFKEFNADVNIYSHTAVNLKKAVSFCNYKVYNLSRTEKQLSGMGATLVAAVYNGKKLFVANIGDSRAYLLSKGEIKQISRDHSFVYELVKSGILTEEEARNHPQRNQITKAIGIVPEVFPDFYSIEFEKDDYLLLCSDGLSNMIEDTEINNIILKAEDLDTAVKELISQANENGGFDNITAVLAKI